MQRVLISRGLLNKYEKTLVATVTAAGFVIAAGSASAAEFFTIGTGGVTDVLYPTCQWICRLVNKGEKSHGVRCSAESTGGSVYNINTIRAGELDMGVAQSDWQYHSCSGRSKFKFQGAFKNFPAVFSVHAEPVSIVARKNRLSKQWLILLEKVLTLLIPTQVQKPLGVSCGVL